MKEAAEEPSASAKSGADAGRPERADRRRARRLSVTLRVFVDPGAAHPVAQLVLVAALFLIGGLMFSLTMALAFGCLGDGVRSTGPLR